MLRHASNCQISKPLFVENIMRKCGTDPRKTLRFCIYEKAGNQLKDNTVRVAKQTTI